jgi:potassium-dependent mechanosensitive channel
MPPDLALGRRQRFMPAMTLMTGVAVFAALLFLSSVTGQAVEQARTDPPPAASAAIPLAEVAKQAMEASILLSKLSTHASPSPDIERMRGSLPKAIEEIALELRLTKSLLKGRPTLVTLQEQQDLWRKRHLDLSKAMNLLGQRATLLQDVLSRLATLEKSWNETLVAAQAEEISGPVIQEIQAVLAGIAGTKKSLQERHAFLMDLQSRIAQAGSQAANALAEVTEAERKAVKEFFSRQALLPWSTELWKGALADSPARIRQVAAERWADIVQYATNPARGVLLHCAIFVVLALFFGAGRMRFRGWAASEDISTPAATVFNHPFSASLFVALYIATSYLLAPSTTVREIFVVLLLVPTIRLLRPVVSQRLAQGLYAAAILFALDSFRRAFAGVPILEQGILVVEILLAMAALGWELNFGDLRRPNGLRALAWFILTVLAIGLTAAVLGYTLLAGILAPAIFVSAVLAAILYAAFRVLAGMVSLALRGWPLRLLKAVQHHSERIERGISRVLFWLAVAAWLYRSLNYIGLFESVFSFGEAILEARLERGSISVSVADVLAFGLTLWFSYLLSALIRFLLQEDVYPRKGVSRGASYAISSLLHYVILALGVVVGLGLLGVDLTRLTVLAGAFGVGLGFGLQSVVNNFVSGLILLFERPIHVGDTIEVGSLSCEIQRIGIRSSIVRTNTGAEIIIPNAQLATEQVTNWTLSDRRRRIDLPVGVNYGANPRKVIEVIESVARAHPRVLKEPGPQGLFVGYGDSSINFELRAWTDEVTSWFQTRSDLAVAVYDAIQAAGMSFPFPQREVRLVGTSER